MKKRNKPILLITILVIFVGVIAAMNTPRSNASAEMPKPADLPETGAPRNNTPGKADLSKAASAGIADATPKKRMMDPENEAMAHMPPSIETPQNTVVQPKPNDSSISGQWYTSGSMKSIPRKN